MGWPTPEDLFVIDSVRIINECVACDKKKGLPPQVERIEFVGPYRGIWLSAIVYVSDVINNSSYSRCIYIADYRVERSPVGNVKLRWHGVPVQFGLSDDSKNLMSLLMREGILSHSGVEVEKWDYVIKLMHGEEYTERITNIAAEAKSRLG